MVSPLYTNTHTHTAANVTAPPTEDHVTCTQHQQDSQGFCGLQSGPSSPAESRTCYHDNEPSDIRDPNSKKGVFFLSDPYLKAAGWTGGLCSPADGSFTPPPGRWLFTVTLRASERKRCCVCSLGPHKTPPGPLSSPPAAPGPCWCDTETDRRPLPSLPLCSGCPPTLCDPQSHFLSAAGEEDHRQPARRTLFTWCVGPLCCPLCLCAADTHTEQRDEEQVYSSCRTQEVHRPLPAPSASCSLYIS